MTDRVYTLRYREFGEVRRVEIMARDISLAEIKARTYLRNHFLFGGFLLTPKGHYIPVTPMD